nr:hypothetical protein [Bradyrhizobium elkanii]
MSDSNLCRSSSCANPSGAPASLSRKSTRCRCNARAFGCSPTVHDPYRETGSRLACRFDELSADTALAQIMRACVVFLSRLARTQETHRRRFELRILMGEVSDAPLGRLPWASVKIDRSNRRWRTLYDLSRLLLVRDWQATHYDAESSRKGFSLLFPMNELFEATIAAALRKALSTYDIDVVTQGGFRYCLGEWLPNSPCSGNLFRTRPDVIIRSRGKVVVVVDTKWKCLRDDADESKRGISQSDVYQLMAYAQLYNCDRLLMLYPHHAGLSTAGVQANYGIAVPGKLRSDQLQIATVDVGQESAAVSAALRQIVLDTVGADRKLDRGERLLKSPI